MDEKDDDSREMVRPVIEGLNHHLADPERLVERKTPDSHIIQLNLNYVDYGVLYRLIELGRDALEKRGEDLREMRDKKTFDYPLTKDDIDRAISQCSSDGMKATDVLRKAKRVR